MELFVSKKKFGYLPCEKLKFNLSKSQEHPHKSKHAPLLPISYICLWFEIVHL